MQKIKAYKRKIDRHIGEVHQTGFQTANFNSLANLNHALNASFGRQSITICKNSTKRARSASNTALKTKSKSKVRKSAISLQKIYKQIKSSLKADDRIATLARPTIASIKKTSRPADNSK